MGYAGGDKANPTYYNLGEHSETIQIDYDPTRISYAQLLDVFWASHDSTAQSWSHQYRALVFYHNEEQLQLALASKEREEERLGRKIYTEIVPFRQFYLAEDYHQKYHLRNEPELAREYEAIYPALDDFINSTAVTRVNGYLGGNGSSAQLEQELDSLGLSTEAKEYLLEQFYKLESRGLNWFRKLRISFRSWQVNLALSSQLNNKQPVY